MQTARLISLIALAASAALAGCSTTASVTKPAEGGGPSTAESRHAVDASYQETLDRLYAGTPGSRELVAKARGVLVFPRVISAGLVVGGAYGEGQLREHGHVEGYYRTTTGSVGWQIGAQSRALVFLFMSEDALQRFKAGHGWSGGVDASVAVLTVGANGALDASASQAPTVAFVLTNAGLMAGATLEGTKVTRIDE
ncbi:YSC84-related protein [Scleromatobacter humisilvae]|uniref:Twin-arginine translocation pathway signal n=1 Tax=Scleromatobacter humisilvae TaxID=2897159 RepID=A0A9X2C118_9BURK|nr:YSC84-related protein [Scleromatobacter humisilvae]MCK9684500.1 twin-arginine translocation pathway signal [Scleromatobacter humisilvae]